MPYIIGFVSQKGGVSKSSLARTLATEMSRNGLAVQILDLDQQQKTSANWSARRGLNDVEPDVSCATTKSVKMGMRSADSFDALIFDGRANASDQTLEIAEVSDLIVVPTGQTMDDLEPAVELAHSLANRDIATNKIAFALCKTTSDSELAGAREYLSATEYVVLAGAVPVKTGYAAAGDQGRALTETKFASLNERADEVIQAIIDQLSITGE